ncbi:Thiol-disulfide isomerase or thioredoxin [Nannocystis exedens]|uniref:Thiol-disulfide isomerase or thioredoxin n=1 Tax=Nannocystis exedens TaxID=54 RepID=A0A1I2J3F7_9BACT|nr:redoxin domain-containing protein [Nannocystis exedens]PCC72493.1 AhpC/TSA family protein [Nannocystis exedens]SFF48403.1 Thiol-disulfide isomerase or thioredoxin [Nannocystis exedens]
MSRFETGEFRGNMPDVGLQPSTEGIDATTALQTRSLRVLGVTAALGAVLLACRRPDPPAVERPDKADRAGALDPQASARMADEIRDLLLEERIEAARARIDVQLAASPDDVRLRWLAAVAALADSDLQALAAHREAVPDGSGWSLLLHAQERSSMLPRQETVALVASARRQLGDHPDAVWLHAQVLAKQSDENGLAALAAVPGLPDSVRDFVHAKQVGLVFFRFGSAPPPMRPSLEQVQELVARAERTAPSGTLAVVRAAEGWLRLGRVDLAVELVERALARRPDALAFTVLRAQARVRQDASLRSAMVGDLAALADEHRTDPDALAQLADGLSSLGAAEAAQAIQDDVRRRFPGARAVERWDFQAASVFGAVGDCRLANEAGTLPEADTLVQARAPVDAFFDRPRIRDSSLRAATAAALVEFLQCEPGAPLQRVEAVARAVLEAPFGMGYDAQASVLVASRGGDLELARALAERAVALAREMPPGFEMVVAPDELERHRRASQALAHHARGLVHLRAARLEEARADISRANELWPTRPDIALLAAELAERDGDFRHAEQILARAIVREGARARACRDRLLELMRARGGKEADLDRTIARLDREWKDERIAEVLAARAAPPKPLAPFELDLRSGGRISSDSLRGRVIVVIATEPWCTGCRLEAPELAKLQRRYRGRKDVQFLVVTSDPDGIAALHEGAGFHTTIAKDDGWRHTVGINSYPTHLFIDATGREVFRASGGYTEMHFTYPALIEVLRRER